MKTLPTLVNFHIPRTGGRSRTEFLSELVGGVQIFHTMGPKKRDFSEYSQSSIAEKKKFRLVTGHMPLEFLKSISKPKFCITFVRNPLYRSISHYNGFKKWINHPIEKLINENNLSLADFLLCGIRDDVYDNVMVRYFLDAPVRFMQINENHLNEAKKNLYNFINFIGITEVTNDSLLALGSLLGIKKIPKIPHIGNLNQERKLARLSVRDRDALLRVNKYDLDFYDYAVKRFKSSIASLGLAS